MSACIFVPMLTTKVVLNIVFHGFLGVYPSHSIAKY